MSLVFRIKKSGFPTQEERSEKIDSLAKTYGKVKRIWSTKDIVNVEFDGEVKKSSNQTSADVVTSVKKEGV